MRRALSTTLCLSALSCGGGTELSLGGTLASSTGGTAGSGGTAPTGGTAGSGGLGGLGGGAGSGGSSAGTGGTAGSAGTGTGGGGTGGIGGPVCDQRPSDIGADALLAEAVGFGEETFGGRDGCVVRVTTAADDAESPAPGSLRAALQSPEPAWIVFDIDQPIELEADISVGPNKTIDGRGAPAIVTIRNYGLRIDGTVSNNVVIHNVEFIGDYANVDYDGIWISETATKVWIDHCAFSGYNDEHIEISHGSTYITVSWSRFYEQDEAENSHALLIGDDTNAEGMVIDTGISVTMHHNWFEAINSYMPRLRYGKVHSFNNWFYHWADRASASSMYGELVSENNVFTAYASERALVSEGIDTYPGYLQTTGDVLQWDGDKIPVEPPDTAPPGGPIFVPRDYYDRDDYRFDPLATADDVDALKALLTTQAGPHPEPRF